MKLIVQLTLLLIFLINLSGCYVGFLFEIPQYRYIRHSHDSHHTRHSHSHDSPYRR